MRMRRFLILQKSRKSREKMDLFVRVLAGLVLARRCVAANVPHTELAPFCGSASLAVRLRARSHLTVARQIGHSDQGRLATGPMSPSYCSSNCSH